MGINVTNRNLYIISIMLVLLANILVPINTFADEGSNNTAEQSSVPHNGMVEPGYKPSPQEVEWHMKKEKDLKEFLEETYGVKYFRILPLEREWREPDDWEHRNYCGPGATQVALDARLLAEYVPDINTIGVMENIDPNWGVYMNDVKDTLNNILSSYDDIPNINGFVGYVLGYPSSSDELQNKILWDIMKGYATISGVYTQGMPGWSRSAYHIVAVFGVSGDYYKYAETSSPTAGYTGPFSQWVLKDDFYQWYTANSVISW